MDKKIEVLAPAGDTERFLAAINYGADAVYLAGTEFGMRANPSNFNNRQLINAVKIAHEKNIKVYVTCNTLPSNDEITNMPDFLNFLQQAGADAVIVADMGVLSLVKQHIKGMDIHISTQVGIVNYAAANAFYEMGAKRVVLARELSLEEIKEIRRKTPPDLEIETFVHGAMCMSVSGRCLLSNYLVNRDANRGECAQPCRWGYHLMEEKRPNQYFPIYEDEKGSYILNAKDLCMIQHIKELADAGVTSFKIEGRAKSAYYVAAITNAYKLAVKAYENAKPLPQWIELEVKKVSHRQYTTGFFFGKPQAGQYYENGGYIRKVDVIAVAQGYEAPYVLCEQKNKFSTGDVIEVLQPGENPFEAVVSEIINKDGEIVESACHPTEKLKINIGCSVPANAILRKNCENCK